MSAQTNQSLVDGLACMQALAVAAEPIGCREMARQLGLNPMRANRLLMTLAEIGLARQDDKKRYAMGPGIHALAAQAMLSSGILKQALPLIKAMSHTGLTVAIGVLWREHVTYLFHGRLGEDIENGIGHMGLYPATQSSIGLLLLSEYSNDSIREIFPDGFAGYSNRKTFMNEIQETRKQKYAQKLSLGENNSENHLSIAVGIGGPRAVAAIALSGIDCDANITDITDLINELQNIGKEIQA